MLGIFYDNNCRLLIRGLLSKVPSNLNAAYLLSVDLHLTSFSSLKLKRHSLKMVSTIGFAMNLCNFDKRLSNPTKTLSIGVFFALVSRLLWLMRLSSIYYASY